MSPKQIENINAVFLSMMNDINTYLMDESVPMECFSEDIDRKLNDTRMEILKMLEA
jgi:hypothetical protein